MVSTQDCISNGKEKKPTRLPRKLRIGSDWQPGDLYFLLGQAIPSSYNQDWRLLAT